MGRSAAMIRFLANLIARDYRLKRSALRGSQRDPLGPAMAAEVGCAATSVSGCHSMPEACTLLLAAVLKYRDGCCRHQAAHQV